MGLKGPAVVGLRGHELQRADARTPRGSRTTAQPCQREAESAQWRVGTNALGRARRGHAGMHGSRDGEAVRIEKPTAQPAALAAKRRRLILADAPVPALPSGPEHRPGQTASGEGLLIGRDHQLARRCRLTTWVSQHLGRVTSAAMGPSGP